MALSFAAMAVLVSALNASMVSGDLILVSTISAQSGLARITFSSSVYIASGSSLTLSGIPGTIVVGSSVTGSSFFGSGAFLAGVGVLSSTQTFSGENIFLSSFTVRSGGREIVVSTSQVVDNLFIDGAGVVRFNPALHNSSATVVPFFGTTNQLFGPCVPGSTITINTAGGRVEISYAGNASNMASYTGFNVLQDGLYLRDLSATKAIAIFRSNTKDILEGSQAFSYLVDAPVAGTHSYCLTIRAPIPSGFPAEVGDSGSGAKRCSSLFYVKEIR